MNYEVKEQMYEGKAKQVSRPSSAPPFIGMPTRR